MSNPHALVERITKTILFIRGEKVLLDANLAALYGVDTGTLVRAVKRNIERFPDDFMLQLTEEEWVNLRSQIGISSSWGGRRYAPYAPGEAGLRLIVNQGDKLFIFIMSLSVFIGVHRWLKILCFNLLNLDLSVCTCAGARDASVCA